MKTTFTHPSILTLFGTPPAEPTAHAAKTLTVTSTPPTQADSSPSNEGAATTAPAKKRPKTDEEKQAHRTQRSEQAKAILEGGLSSIAEDPEALARYLAFRSRFHEYSPTNTVLILMQRPSARYCMGYRSWQKHGRQVRKGETGLMVYAPILSKPTKDEIAAGDDPKARKVRGFRIATTFDYEQTDAVTDDALVYESPSARLGTSHAPDLAQRLRRLAGEWGYSVETATGYADGHCNFARHVIGVQPGLAVDDEAAVLAHELAHAAAHEPKKGTDAPRLTRAERELQAEGAAFMALYQLGLDTSRASLPYLSSYAKDDDALLVQFAEIERIAALIVEGVTEVAE